MSNSLSDLGPAIAPFSRCDCDPTRTNALFHAASGAYTAIPLTEQNTERLPLYHQLDVRVDKRWVYQRWMLNLYLNIQNIYNRANPEGLQYSYDFSQSKTQQGLPILPILGIRADF